MTCTISVAEARERAQAAEPVTPDDPRLPQPVRDRIRLDHDSGCWVWLGVLSQHRPVISMTGHRRAPIKPMIWTAIHGILPKGTMIRQGCHNGLCVSPNAGHLTPLTRYEKRGRYQAGWRPIEGNLGIPLLQRIVLDTADFDARKADLERGGYDTSLMVPVDVWRVEP